MVLQVNLSLNIDPHSHPDRVLLDIKKSKLVNPGNYSPLLSFTCVLIVDILNAIIEGYSLGGNKHYNYDSLISIVFRTVVIAFCFANVLEILEFKSRSFLVLTILYSGSVPFGIVLSILFPNIALGAYFKGILSCVNSGLLVHMSLFHLLPSDLLTNFEDQDVNKFKAGGFIIGYILVVIGTICFPFAVIK